MEQYTPYANNSEHPSTLTVYTKLLLESLTFLLTTLVILSEKVDPNKVHCYDMISIVLLTSSTVDEGMETRTICLDISKVFHKV